MASRDPENLLLARQSRRRVEAEVIRDLALAASGQLTTRLGGPSVRPPQPTEYATLTYANSAKWVESHAYQSVILVTNNYHMPRSLLEMGRLLRAADLRPYPVVNTRLDDGLWVTKPGALRVLFTEYTKYLAALARGILQTSPAADDTGVVNASVAAS